MVGFQWPDWGNLAVLALMRICSCSCLLGRGGVPVAAAHRSSSMAQQAHRFGAGSWSTPSARRSGGKLVRKQGTAAARARRTVQPQSRSCLRRRRRRAHFPAPCDSQAAVLHRRRSRARACVRTCMCVCVPVQYSVAILAQAISSRCQALLVRQRMCLASPSSCTQRWDRRPVFGDDALARRFLPPVA